MLQLFPFATWLAVVTSVVLLAALSALGDLGPRPLAIVVPWFALAAYCQFFGVSAVASAAGLALQTVLAIYLILRWRLAE